MQMLCSGWNGDCDHLYVLFGESARQPFGSACVGAGTQAKKHRVGIEPQGIRTLKGS